MHAAPRASSGRGGFAYRAPRGPGSHGRTANRCRDTSPPLAAFTDLQMCYFAALCEGLRVIESKKRDLILAGKARPHRFHGAFGGDYSNALQQYVHTKGSEIAFACGLGK